MNLKESALVNAVAAWIALLATVGLSILAGVWYRHKDYKDYRDYAPLAVLAACAALVLTVSAFERAIHFSIKVWRARRFQHLTRPPGFTVSETRSDPHARPDD